MNANIPPDAWKKLGDLRSLAEMMAEMKEFRKLHPAPAPPDKPQPRQKRSGRKK